MDPRDEREFVVAALAAEYPEFPKATITRLVGAEMDFYGTATVRTFLPLLVQRGVGRRLHAAASLGDPPRFPAGASTARIPAASEPVPASS